ncbi:hypothetical protein PPYR_02661 [Photinus pyralis]|uniref:FYVE-type domain-containing protein n=1 Tax=Photinus pyralis TaxID=7054 RepID=A0A5N4B7U1_PHOPY|nr:zinc finger FYVE domain-containing protein 26 homolog [Photinus pyralis]KAB0805691.1 hypothetical protein PPYR_02661 [Photinus pyralis]
MEELKRCVEELSSRTNECADKYKNRLYRLLSQTQLFGNNIDDILPKLFALIHRGAIQRDLMYLCLLSNDDTKAISMFLEYEKSSFQLDLKDSSSLYDFCVFTNKHWLLETIQNNVIDEDQFSIKIVLIFRILQLIAASNEENINLQKINEYIQLINTQNNSFIEQYIHRLNNIVDITRICSDVSNSDVYYYAATHTPLNTFSTFLNLGSSSICDAISAKLSTTEDPLESDTFAGFNILSNLFDCLKMCKNVISGRNLQYKDEISDKISIIKMKLTNLRDFKMQVEILENIFVLLFLQEKHLNGCPDKNGNNFYCTEKEVRLILMLLKTVMDNMKIETTHKQSDEYRRFTELNRNVSDGLWRLELLVSDLNKKYEKNVISYLLSSPESLIHLSLKQNDFNKAHQVIQIFNIQHSNIASEINYSVNFIDLKANLRKSYKMQQIAQKNPNISVDCHSREEILNEFFKTNYIESREPEENSSNRHLVENIGPQTFKFMTIVDLILTLPNSADECRDLIKLAVTYSDADIDEQHLNFFKRITEAFTVIDTLSMKEILCNSEFELNTDQQKSKESFYIQLQNLANVFCKQLETTNDGKLNEKHSAHKIFIKLHQLFLSNYTEGKEHMRYLLRLFNYLKGFSKIFYVEQNNSDVISKGKNTSLFTILTMGRSEILEKLLFERNLDISDFEQLFLKLKLDLVYHVASIFFPSISLSSSYVSERKELRPPNAHVITYIQKRNWLLAYILKNIYKIEDSDVVLNEVRIKALVNFLKLPRIQHLTDLYNNNAMVTALQQSINPSILKEYFDKRTVKINDEIQPGFLLGSQVSTGSLETGEEIFEGSLKITDWKHLFDIIDNIPQYQLCNNAELMDLRDKVLIELVSDCFEPDFYKYVQYITNDRLRCECILNNFTTWPGEFCISVMKSEMSSFSPIDQECRAKFKEWCETIDLCEKIRNMSNKDTWFEVWQLSSNKPSDILQTLITTVHVEILLQFIDIFEIDSKMLESIDEHYFIALFDSMEYSKIEVLLSKLPIEYATSICHNLVTTLRNLEHLSFTVDIISKWNLVDHNNILKDIKISLSILSCFTQSEQENLWCLIAEPSTIVEMLVMNTRLEKLGQVLEKIRPDLENCEFDESELSLEKIDDILRTYAEKSLEFRVVLQPEVKFINSPESSKLLQSLDSINFTTAPKYFVMPEMVPAKTEWVENYEVTECMCCAQTTFSMFNRRHHCRRCGRVVCGTCSVKRMHVPTYENILVRVCLDCYDQAQQDGAGTSSSKSEASIRTLAVDWLLTDDTTHNEIVREEFSYEYAPSVSLCLSILKHHSKNEEYPKFLLDQCDAMLRLLQPMYSESLQEIDYLLVIKMLKSLAIAAKMLSAQCMLQWGSSLADRILSQADLLGLLAERDCLHLIPTTTPSQVRYIDANTLRRLRDKLLEREQWNLALEVSTKAGLDNAGVFAAWGKSYLKAGSLQRAREKFQRCFDKTAHYETSTELSNSYSSTQLPHYLSKVLHSSENRPIKNPPLLNEIIQILESYTTIIDPKIVKEVKMSNTLLSSTCSLNSSTTSVQNDMAVCILNKLRNLNNVMNGNYSAYSDTTESMSSVGKTKPYLEPLFYEECVYYLTKYGSHISVLEFYLKHSDYHQCLKYMLDHRLNSDYFIDVYMLCLKENCVSELHETMSEIDSTLDIWKDYLKHICRHLEKQSNLNSLYELQQFMGDFVRAALTCIKFYKDDAATFTELTGKVDYLHKAQQHLQQELEQEQWVEVASVRKPNMDSQDSFEAKGIANPSLVMKIDTRNVDKHINTISRQIEVAKFLADCEFSSAPVMQILPEILPFVTEDASFDSLHKTKIPTLFGSYYERVQLAVLAIVCGTNIEDGFGIAYRIITDHKLSAVKVYCQAGKQLAKSEKYNSIAQLVNCIRSSGVSDSAVTDMCDEMLILAVQTLTKTNVSGPQLDGLIKLITDRAAKISAYIESKQLKTAYLLAVKHKRMGDIRRILREAEFLNQPSIKTLCQKILHSHSHFPSHSKD